MSERICQTCRAWECAPDDAYCGLCGAACAELTLEAFPRILQVGHLAPNIRFRVTTPSCGRIPVEKIDVPPWLSLPGPQPPQLPPSATATFTARAATFEMTAPAGALVR